MRLPQLIRNPFSNAPMLLAGATLEKVLAESTKIDRDARRRLIAQLAALRAADDSAIAAAHAEAAREGAAVESARQASVAAAARATAATHRAIALEYARNAAINTCEAELRESADRRIAAALTRIPRLMDVAREKAHSTGATDSLRALKKVSEANRRLTDLQVSDYEDVDAEIADIMSDAQAAVGFVRAD